MKKTVLFLMALMMSAGFAFSQTVLPPSSNVPGITISNDGVDGAGWTGANIILGNDASVWPWSIAGDDGAVAFTPVEGATYHMTFNVTGLADGTGANTGFRVRWNKSDAGDNDYTAGDVTAVNTTSFTADQTADFVPARFTEGVSKDVTKTYKVDFTMDGSQLAEQLVGNLAIRGLGGNNTFVINTIVITDDEGNILVNYDKDAVIVLPPSSNVPGITISNDGVDGAGWTGANIILGNDASVWPWSIAGDDGAVAFTPVEGATYHMTFNVTGLADGTGANTGFRVRWNKSDAGDNDYTAGDVTAVNTTSFTADQTADFVPARFTEGVSKDVTKTYKVDFTMDGSQLAEQLVGNLAIRGLGGNNTFVINTIVITDDKGNMLVNYDKDAAIVLPPSSNVPGITISNDGVDGAGWTGANIILGNDASVWPWSIAGDDGAVAFTPVEGATYHMTFNVTGLADGTGANTGFRVRWNKSDAGDNDYTAGDVAAVNTTSFTADQIADFVPARFTEGVSKDVTKTYKVDFTMDGSQLAEQLVGNLAIRGLGGNNTFVINTIVITDDEGNMLVNYDKDIQSGIAQIKLDVSQVYNADGGIIVTGHNENVSVYAIDGRLVKQTIANQDTYIPLQRGLYIVRVGANQAVKALVK